MKTPLDQYTAAGQACAAARNKRDETEALKNQQWLGRTLREELNDSDELAGAKAFDAAYRATRRGGLVPGKGGAV